MAMIATKSNAPTRPPITGALEVGVVVVVTGVWTLFPAVVCPVPELDPVFPLVSFTKMED